MTAFGFALLIMTLVMVFDTFSLAKTMSGVRKFLQAYELLADMKHGNGKTTVNCSLHIQRLGVLDPSKMVDFEVDLYLKLTWLDDLVSSHGGLNLTEPLDIRYPELLSRVWKPDIYFPNAKQEEFQFITSPNILLKIQPDGIVHYVTRLQLSLSCMNEMSGYPLDFQKCAIELSVFSYSEDVVALQWHNDSAVTLEEQFNPSEFGMTKFFLRTCKMILHSGRLSSCLRVDIKMQRSIGHHLVRSYVPSIMIVAISWVSFWLDACAVPARVTLGVMTLLTITSESVNQKGSFPPVSSVKALDVWMWVCTVFVFAALVEFTAVNYSTRPPPLRKRESSPTCDNNEGFIYLNYKVLHKPKKRKLKKKTTKSLAEKSELKKIRAYKLDQISRVLFPAVFILFNCVYWPYYIW